MFVIKQIQREQVGLVAEIIREAYKEQARLLDITKENYPSYAGFESKTDIEEALSKGFKVCLLYEEKQAIGTIRYWIDRNNKEKGYISRLAVLPTFCNKGGGSLLLKHAENALYARGVKRIEICFIKDCKEFEAFYKERGYKVTTDLMVNVLPYGVRYMELNKATNCLVMDQC